MARNDFEHAMWRAGIPEMIGLDALEAAGRPLLEALKSFGDMNAFRAWKAIPADRMPEVEALRRIEALPDRHAFCRVYGAIEDAIDLKADAAPISKLVAAAADVLPLRFTQKRAAVVDAVTAGLAGNFSTVVVGLALKRLTMTAKLMPSPADACEACNKEIGALREVQRKVEAIGDLRIEALVAVDISPTSPHRELLLSKGVELMDDAIEF